MSQAQDATAAHMLIVCGPSGVGKSTLNTALLRAASTIGFSVSYTTRAPRGSERDGVEYHFVDRAAFDALVAEGAFAEWAEVHGNRYGTTKATIAAAAAAGRDLLFDIDYQGARQLKAVYPQAWGVLIAPPDLDVLERRLRGRGTDDEAVIQRRLAKAREELAQEALFDFVIVNRDLDEAQRALQSIYHALRLRRLRRAGADG